MIEPDHPDLSIGQQCKLLSIARSSYCYEPKGETEQNLGLMRRVDEQFLGTPFFGVRQMTWHLGNDGDLVNEKRIRRRMRRMGLMPIYQKPNTCRPTKGHKTYPYLLKGLHVDRPNQVPSRDIRLANALPGSGCSDITYLPMRRGFLYLVAIMDWHTRKVLSWRISNTPPLGVCVQTPAGQREADFCVEALNEAIHKFGPPEIMNTDQGSQFTSFAWTDRLRRSGVRISMDGKGRFLHSRGLQANHCRAVDNIFIERLWRTLKYACVYLHAWETGSETKAAIRKWMTFYNQQRPHSALGGTPPAVVYWQRNDINQPDQQVQRVA